MRDAFEHIEKDAWSERYAAIEKQLQKYANEAKEHNVSNSKNSENSLWHKIDFTKRKKRLSGSYLHFELYILFVGKIFLKNSDISFD